MVKKRVRQKYISCKFCKKKIDLKKDKYTLLGTYQGGKVIDESYFHFNHFVIWYNKKVQEAVQKHMAMIRSVATKGLGLLKNMGLNFKNIQSAMGMDVRGEMPQEVQQIPSLFEALGLIQKKKDGKKEKRKRGKSKK